MKAVIFDLDGVLLDTGILHKSSLVDALYVVTGIYEPDCDEVSEKSMESSVIKIKKFLRRTGRDEDLSNRILAIKDYIYISKIRHLTVTKNVIECLDFIRSKNIKTAIASNSRLSNINRILDLTGLRKYFDVIVSGYEVNNRKPAPDILFEVYDRLGLTVTESAQTLFIDDTEEGCAAGYSSLSTTVKINRPEDLTIELLNKWIK